jgi:D-inositol-3-phosphate glycosyltransferase
VTHLFSPVYRAGLLRAGARTRVHLARARRALAFAGPGRRAGMIVDTRLSPQALAIEGWAALPSNDIQCIWVTVDGAVRALAETGLSTPKDDEGRVLTRWSDQAGWRATLERESIDAGTHRIGALVLRGYGLVEVLEPHEMEFPTTGKPGAIDEPATGAVVAANLAVRGWFLSGRGYDCVEVSVDGAKPVRARLLAFPRPDLVAEFGDPDAPLAGWEARIPLEPQLDEDITLVVDAVGPRGRLRLGERTVRCEPRDWTVAEPDRAAVLEARTALLTAGYGADSDGLNLLIATHHLGLGGGQLYLQELLRHLLRNNDVTCTVLSRSDGPLRDELESLGARVHVVGETPSTAVPYEQWLHQVAALVATTGSNVVLANTAGSYWAVDLAARLDIPSVWAIHESFTPEIYLQVGLTGPPDELIRRRFLEAFNQAGAVVFEADATMRLFQHLIRDGRGLRVDYGIDLERVRAFVADNPRQIVRERLDVRPEQILVMCMGTYEPRKGQALLATAFARVAEEHPRAVLAMVGDTGDPYSLGIHSMVDNFGITDRVRLVPVTPNIEDWYLAADAFILASDVESLPRSMLEAMAFGTPVILSAVFGVPEVIEDGVNGFLFESSSVASASDVLRRVLRLSRKERQRVGDAGRLTVETNRSSANYASAYRIIFGALMSEEDVDLAMALTKS